jgi:hypothetical protein
VLSNPQKALLKRAQREAGLDDSDYREVLATATANGCRSSTDSRFTDRDLDVALAYIEAIAWRKFAAGALQPSCRPNAVFVEKGFWAQRNTKKSTTRDRYALASVGHEISHLEAALAGLGFGSAYCAGIRSRVAPGREDPSGLHLYKVALARTLRAKKNKILAASSLAG